MVVKLGYPDWPTQVTNKPYFDVRSYAFSRTNGEGATGDLSVAGVNTILLSPVPAGVNGSDLNHYIRISSGTGTAETVLIIGGTAVSEADSGTLTFTTVNTHTGAWKISTATSGGQEALNDAVASVSFRRIHFPAGSYTNYAPINGNGASNVLISGDQGQSSISLIITGFTTTSVQPWTPDLTIGDGYFFVNQGEPGTSTTLSADVNFPVTARDESIALTITVTSVPGDWVVGDYLGMQYQGWGTDGGGTPAKAGQQEFYQVARILDITGTTITFEEPIVIPLAASANPAIPGGYNQSLITKLEMIDANVIRDLTIDGLGSSGAYGGVGLYFCKDSSVQNCTFRNTSNSAVSMGKGYRNSVIQPKTFNCWGFSDIWCIGITHLLVQGYRAIRPNFGLGIWWATFFDVIGYSSIYSQGRGVKFHGCAWGNATNGLVIRAAMTGHGIQGGTFNSNFSNCSVIACGWSQPGNSTGFYFSGEGNLNNRIANIKAIGNSGNLGTADMDFGAAFGFSDNRNSVLNLEAPGGWTDGGVGNHVMLASFPAAGATNSSGQSIPNGTKTALTFDTNIFDYALVHSTSVDTEKFTVPNSSQGIYEMGGQVEFAANATGYRTVEVWRNGLSGGLVASIRVPANASGTTVVPIPSGAQTISFGTDYFTVYVVQDSGGALSTVQGAGHTFSNFRRVR